MLFRLVRQWLAAGFGGRWICCSEINACHPGIYTRFDCGVVRAEKKGLIERISECSSSNVHSYVVMSVCVYIMYGLRFVQ